MANNELHDVFISYRRYEDNEKTNPKGLLLAERIYNYLTEKGLKVFWDKPEMKPGDFAEQLDWQLEHCPNYIFIATENAMRFREGQEDFVEHELKTALALYDKAPEDRIILPIFPYSTIEEKQSATAKGPYDPAVERVQWLHGVELSAVKPSNDELREILRHVTRITRSNMWNAGYRWLQQAKQERFAGITINDSLFSLAGKHKEVRFPINVRRKGEEEQPLMDAIRDAQTHLYLIGAGGIGKTTALLRIMEEAYDEENGKQEFNRISAQVPLFIELSRAPDVIPDDRGSEWQVYSSGKSTFIHREIYRQVRRDLRLRQIPEGLLEQIDDIYKADYEVAVRPITNLLGDSKPEPEYLLLLDGLNEVSRREIKKYNEHGELEFNRSVISMVLDEIRQIMKYKNVRVILTSRSRESVNLTENIELLDLSGIKSETIEQYLMDMNVSEARITAALYYEKLQDVLRTPLFLIMYAQLSGEEELFTAGEIMHLFYHGKSTTQYTQAARAAEVQRNVKESSENAEPATRVTPEIISFILDFILPEIAWNMVKEDSFQIGVMSTKTHVGLEEIILHVLNDTSNTAICGKYGKQAFQDYLSPTNPKQNTRRMAKLLIEALSGNETDEDAMTEELVGSILGCILMTLGIMRTDGREYSFIHHHIRDYFAAVYQINNLNIALAAFEAGDNETARLCLADWKERPLPTMTRQFIGEALGEAHNAPICDEKGNWHYNVPTDPCERNMIEHAFELFWDRFDGEDGYSIWNLLQILKDTRQDLSGADLSRLDLSICEANGYALGKRNLTSSLKGAKLSERFFMFGGHTGSINTAAYSPDRRRIVTASEDKTAMLWDVDTLQPLGTLREHTDKVTSAAFSLDGHRIVTTSWDKTAILWDADTLQPLGTLRGHTDKVTFAAFSSDRRYIVTASWDKTAMVWDAETLQPLGTLRGHTDKVSSAAFSLDGHYIVTASWDKTAMVWDAETLQPLGALCGHTDRVSSAAFSSGGRRIVTASYDDTAKVWDTETLQLIGTLKGHVSWVNSAAYSPDGRRIITASWDGSAMLWDAKTLQPISTLRKHVANVTSAIFSQDGRRIVTASEDRTAMLWDADTLQPLGTLRGHTDYVNSATYSPDGRRIITASADQTAMLWDVNTLQPLGTLHGHTEWVTSAAFSPDGHRIVTGSYDATAILWDADTLQPLGSLWGHTLLITSVAFSSDGHKIVTTSYDKTAILWDADTLQQLGVLRGYTSFINSAAYSPNRRHIVTASWDKAAVVWDAETLQPLAALLGHTEDKVTSAAFNPDGHRIVTASADQTVMVWDADTLQKIGTMKWHTDSVTCATYSPDGSRIVTASWDKTAMVWDAETLQPLGPLYGHTGRVSSAAFSPDGLNIITASYDGTAKIWDAETFECLHTIHNIPGLEVIGVDLRHLHPDSQLSDEVKERLYEYGAILDERG